MDPSDVDDKKSNSQEETSPAASVVIVSEYDEYLSLANTFQGERLKKLVRNAKLFGALADLGMSGQDWNTALSVFFVTYALGGVPSNMALKRYGPKIWIPLLMTLVGIVLVCTGLQNSFGGWTAFRLLLGLVEAGMFPGCSFVLTSWYSPKELHSRMTIFYSGASAAGAFSGILAYAIGHLDHKWGYRGWRFIYVIEGTFTVVVAVLAYFVMYDTPAKVTTKWLDDDEKRYLVLRHKFSAGGDSGIAEKEGFSMAYAVQACKSPHTYAIAVIEFTIAVVVYGISFVLPTIINNLGYSAARSQAMSAPPYIFACIVTIFSGWAADRYKQRMLSIVIPNLMAVAGFVIIIATVRYPHLPGVTLLGVFLVAGGLYPISPAVMAWSALNTAGTMKRAVGMALMVSFSQLGGIMGSNIYISSTAPEYPVGFGVSLGMLVVFAIIWPVIYFFLLKRVNKKRAAMSLEEIHAKYTDEQLAEMGDESPLFRYST
ncbi:hypothetical protein BP5796_09281 [Coleophoma crateriformis]|uniref:Major facilitator superfamily (MFS) profile domain-containing protein n=1 Tax=Coleophoma crateriformis TaxID=565419 RepID=A0A3D8R482_9HELO|nr:hypothetical protein BP5796_09281 [Coleophoma crateriformis]